MRSLDVLSIIVDLTPTHTKNVHCLHIENQQHMCFYFIPDKIDYQQNYLATSLYQRLTVETSCHLFLSILEHRNLFLVFKRLVRIQITHL